MTFKTLITTPKDAIFSTFDADCSKTLDLEFLIKHQNNKQHKSLDLFLLLIKKCVYAQIYLR